MTTRTGNFPIAFRRGWGDWTRNLASLSKWAAQDENFNGSEAGEKAGLLHSRDFLQGV
jgi:hypothetical protein